MIYPLTKCHLEQDQLFPTTAGAPKGGLISSLLANFALNGMDQAVRAVAQAGDQVHFVRYADDLQDKINLLMQAALALTQEALLRQLNPTITIKVALSRGLAPRTSAFAERRAELITP